MANSVSELLVPTGIVSITPSDTVDLSKSIRAFMVTVAGDVAVIMVDGTTGTYPECSPGIQYLGRIRRVKDDGTDATGIVGFY